MKLGDDLRMLSANGTKDLCLRIGALLDIYNTYRALGRSLGIDHAYLQRMHRGVKTNPSAAVLRKLSLVKEVRYRYCGYRMR